MSEKNQSRLRRARKGRSLARRLRMPRLSIHRTGQHIYAQVFTPDGDQVLASASTMEKTVREGLDGSSKNTDAAIAVGKAVAEKAKEAGIEQVAFDRSGYKYHGRVKALADAAREAGLKF